MKTQRQSDRRRMSVRSILAVLLVAWLWPASALAQITVTWANSYGTAASNTVVNAIAVDGAGNVYVAGYFGGASLTVGATTLTRIGTQDVFVAKLDSSGTPVWARNFGGAGAIAAGRTIAVDGSGNVHVGGYFDANLTTPALTRIGTQDAFALKLDSSGTPVWAKNFGGAGASAAGNAIAVDGSGNVHVGGSFGGANLTTPALTRIGFSDAFALKLDSSGTTTWARNFGGAGAIAPGTAIAVDGSGNVYVGGRFDANLTTPVLTRIGIQDAFALKLNSSGTTTWASNFGGAGASATGAAIAVDGSGNVHLGGNFQSADLTTPALTRIGNQDAFALKLDSSGATTWARNFGGAGATASGSAVAVDGSGNVHLGGNFQSANLTTPALTRIGSTDAFAFKLDSSGTTASAKNFGGAGAGADGTAIAVDGSGNVHLGGNFQSAALTTPALTRIGSTDAFIIKAATVHYALTVTTSGSGTATSSPAGISCGATCSADFALGTSVTLTAAAGSGYSFSGWSGACSGAGPATVSMTEARACTAAFAETPPPSWLGTNGSGRLNFSSLEVTIGANGQISTAIPTGNFNASGLTFTALQADGSALPSWLTFDPATLSFTGTVPALAAASAAPDGPARPLAVAASSGRWLATAPARVAVRLTISLRVSDATGQSTTVRFPFVAYYPRSQATVVAVSVTDTGAGANGAAAVSAMSDDGQAVVFQVTATNLVPGDSGSTPDVFRYDVASGVLDRFSTGSFMGTIAGRAQGWSGSPAVSADARTIAFASDAANVGTVWNFGPRQVWVADASAARVSTVTPSPGAASAAADGSLANGASDNPSLSEDGRYVAFESEATNLVAGTSTAAHRVYVKDRTTGAIVLAGTGRRASISADGRHVAYDDGERVHRKDLVTDATLQVGSGTAAKLSRDGRYVAFQSGGGVHWQDLGTSILQTVAADGGSPALSGDGRFVAFVAQGQVWMRDVVAATTALVSTATGAGNGASSDPAISGDGRFVSFASAATDLVASMTGTQLYVAGNPLLAPLATGWWWNPGEPGRGFAVETRGDQLMLGTLLYASDGSPVWYLASGAVTSSSFASALQQYQGGQTLGGAYRAPALLGSVGTATLAISSRSEATASGALSTSLQRFEFSSGGVTAGPQLGSPEGGWWWNPDGPGTGWYLEIQNATMFLAGFLYDAGGTATWVWAVGSMSTSRTFTGTLSRCTGGQTLGGAYQAATCSADQGTVTLAFSSPIAAALTLPTGGRIALGRFRF